MKGVRAESPAERNMHESVSGRGTDLHGAGRVMFVCSCARVRAQLCLGGADRTCCQPGTHLRVRVRARVSVPECWPPERGESLT